MDKCMKITIKNVSTYYEVHGTGSPVILLHGWGQSTEAFKPVTEHLKETHQVYVLDFPGFGQSEEPSTVWGVFEYTQFLEEFISTLQLKNPTIFGHSFGGRVGIYYASLHDSFDKLVLIDSAGIKPKRGLDYYCRIYTYKLGKKILSLPFLTPYKEHFMKKAGSSDYQNCSEQMKKIMVKVVNEDLTPLLHSIQAETLLVWGDLDDATPLSDAKLMEKEIPNAGLVVFEGAGHYSYLERLPQFLRVIDVFLSHSSEKGDVI